MLPNHYRENIRRLQIFTIANQLRKVAELKTELTETVKEASSSTDWASW